MKSRLSFPVSTESFVTEPRGRVRRLAPKIEAFQLLILKPLLINYTSSMVSKNWNFDSVPERLSLL